MMGPRSVKASSTKSAHELPDSWASERFAVVPGGNDQIALHNPWRNRFISMTPSDTGLNLAWALGFGTRHVLANLITGQPRVCYLFW